MPGFKRIEKIREILIRRNIDALLIFDEKNIYYFTGFPWGFRLLIPLDGECVLFVHAVNYEAAKEMAENVRIDLIRVGERADEKVLREIGGYRFKSIGFDRASASEYIKIKDRLKDTIFKHLEDDIWSLRKVKDSDELALISRAAELTKRGMMKAIEVARPGLKGWEVAAEIEYEMRRLGSSGVAFDTIVCSGPESAFPHGGLGEREIRWGDFIVIDVGAKYRGYCADMTRTLVAGKPSEKQERLYEVVREAQRLAINQVRAGVKAKDVDGAARKYIGEKGYGEYFVHGLGHGLGLDIHEPPAISPTGEEELCYGNVITIEPGIYIPKFGGIRIEDTILVLEEKAEKLTYLDLDENIPTSN
ncbi:MAG: Xaa-Pro peptidase family protein [Candidatus Bathyarchaeota archaeon]|nr:Xaa-Pro peptidase family protein [Candidatus Bathyarchaeota archaeon]